MDLLATVILLLISCFEVQVEGSKTVCVKCLGCAPTSVTIAPPEGRELGPGEAGSCSTEGFCISRMGISGTIDQGCSEDKVKYDHVGCFDVDDKTVRVCRCDESHCNTKYDDETAASPESTGFTWWMILLGVIAALGFLLLLVLFAYNMWCVPAKGPCILPCWSKKNQAGASHPPDPSAPPGPSASPPSPSTSPPV